MKFYVVEVQYCRLVWVCGSCSVESLGGGPSLQCSGGRLIRSSCGQSLQCSGAVPVMAANSSDRAVVRPCSAVPVMAANSSDRVVVRRCSAGLLWRPTHPTELWSVAAVQCLCRSEPGSATRKQGFVQPASRGSPTSQRIGESKENVRRLSRVS